jgi:hypothetical protein
VAKKNLENNKVVKDAMMTFHQGGIESNQVVSFIPFSSVGRLWVGEIKPNVSILIIGVFLILPLASSFVFRNGMIVFFTFCMAALGAYLIYKYIKGTVYALNIETSAGTTFSFMATERKYVNKSYDLVRNELNKREEYRTTGTYNFINGVFDRVAIGDDSGVYNT